MKLLLLIVLLDACSSPVVCKTHYRDDGVVTPGHRRYYAVQVCERVLCDSETRLPNSATQDGGCR